MAKGKQKSCFLPDITRSRASNELGQSPAAFPTLLIALRRFVAISLGQVEMLR